MVETEVLVKETENIGGQRFKVNFEKIKETAVLETDDLISTLDSNKKLDTMPEEEKDLFKKNLIKFKESQLEVKAAKKIIEK